MRKVPLPLALLVAIACVLAAAWSVLQPPFQGPDEIEHVLYVQRIVDAHDLPWVPPGRSQHGPERQSTEMTTALRWSGMEALLGNASMKATQNRADEAAWAGTDARLPGRARENGGFESTMRNPPLYYLYAAVPYALTSQDGLFDRAFAVRLANLPFVAALVVCTWLLIGLVAGPRRWLQALGAGIVALNAQLLDLAATANPDVLLAALFGAGYVLMALVLLRGPTRGRLLGLIALGIASPFVHPRGLALTVAAVLTVVIVSWRGSSRRAVTIVTALAAAATIAVVTLAATAGDPTPTSVRQFGSYVWQFYLPRVGFMTPTIVPEYGVRQVFVDRFWGSFAQFDATTTGWVLSLLAVAAMVGGVALVAVLVARRRTLAHAGGLAAVLGTTIVVYLLTIHTQAWRRLLDAGDPVITGRYLLPFLPLLGLGVVLLVSWMPRRVSVPAAAALLCVALALQFAALGTMLVRFHG